MTSTIVSYIVGDGRADERHGRGKGRLVIWRGVHRQFPDVLLRLKHDDVDLGRVEAEQSHIRAQADGHAQSCDLDLVERDNVYSDRLTDPAARAAKDVWFWQTVPELFNVTVGKKQAFLLTMYNL